MLLPQEQCPKLGFCILPASMSEHMIPVELALPSSPLAMAQSRPILFAQSRWRGLASSSPIPGQFTICAPQRRDLDVSQNVVITLAAVLLAQPETHDLLFRGLQALRRCSRRCRRSAPNLAQACQSAAVERTLRRPRRRRLSSRQLPPPSWEHFELVLRAKGF